MNSKNPLVVPIYCGVALLAVIAAILGYRQWTLAAIREDVKAALPGLNLTGQESETDLAIGKCMDAIKVIDDQLEKARLADNVNEQLTKPLEAKREQLMAELGKALEASKAKLAKTAMPLDDPAATIYSAAVESLKQHDEMVSKHMAENPDDKDWLESQNVARKFLVEMRDANKKP